MLVIEGDTARRLMDQMKRYKKIAEVMAVKVPRDFVINQESSDAAINGRLTAKAGSYLALSPAGALYPIDAKVFESTYQEVTDERAGKEG